MKNINEFLNKIICGDCLEVMKDIPSESVDLTVTSPPYDNLRTYNGYSFNFEGIAKELYRVTKNGGVIVWIVGDATIKGSETGTSFKQALYFKEIGFNIHDTMIWNKGGFSAVGALKTRYAPVFEYMFIFTKGKLKTFNPLKDKPNKCAGMVLNGTIRNKDGSIKDMCGKGKKVLGDFGQRFNIWEQPAQRQQGKDKHPAPFPEKLINDHIVSWSNEGDTILDPMCGSGTTLKMAKINNRKFIGIEISSEYIKIAEQRLKENNK